MIPCSPPPSETGFFWGCGHRRSFWPPLYHFCTLYRSNSPKNRSLVFGEAQNSLRMKRIRANCVPKTGRNRSLWCGKVRFSQAPVNPSGRMVMGWRGTPSGGMLRFYVGESEGCGGFDAQWGFGPAGGIDPEIFLQKNYFNYVFPLRFFPNNS
jgi:hypothetical protein